MKAFPFQSNYTFTFQSGDIQIIFELQAYLGNEKFTFQSGDIQIIYFSQIKIYLQLNLHSNLVIFKLNIDM